MSKGEVDADAQYRGPRADARAARIQAMAGTDAETLADAVWMLRYTSVKHGIQWPTHQELMELRRDE
jgi:hypothetical protein